MPSLHRAWPGQQQRLALMAFKRHTLSRHNTNSRNKATFSLQNYMPSVSNHLSPKTAMGYIGAAQARSYAKRYGWNVRTDPKGFVKVWEVGTGNVTFAQTTSRAIWGMKSALEHCKEINQALIRLMIEK
jgi:hypothetical protein